MTKAPLQRLQVWLLPGCMIAVTLFLMGVSINWRPSHDISLMMYCGFLMEEAQKVPYRDFFEMNAPGTHLFHWGVVKLLGVSELNQRLLDLGWLLATQTALVLYLKRWGMSVALCSASAISIQYLSWGSTMTLEREFLCLLPLCLCLLLAFRCPRLSLVMRGAGIGLLLGACVTVKPPLAIYFPFFLTALVYWSERPAAGSESSQQSLGEPRAVGFRTMLRRLIPSMPPLGLARLLLVSLVGFAVFPAACYAYLQANGAWDGFHEMATEYWPLYAELRGNARVTTGLFDRYRIFLALNGSADFMFLGIAAIAAFVALPTLFRKGSRQSVEAATMIGLCALGWVYAFSTGKYWKYHMLPLYFGYSLLAGFSVRVIVQGNPIGSATWLRCLVLLVLFIQPLKLPDATVRILEGGTMPLHRDIEMVCSKLKTRARPGDKAQPLDVTSGAVHAMLLAKVDLATPFMYDFHFYHHPGSKINKRLRKRFIASLQESQPRFLIVATKPWRSIGYKSARKFSELDELILNEYEAIYAGTALVLMERKR